MLSSTPQPVIRKHSFQQILNIHSPVKKNHSLLEYTRDNDTQVSKLGPSCKYLNLIFGQTASTNQYRPRFY